MEWSVWCLVKAAVAGGREEVNTLNQTILKMTETLKSFEKTQSEQASKITQLTDDLEVRDSYDL